MTFQTYRAAVAATITIATAAGCVAPLSASSPLILNRLKLVSAGHTGCLPEANDITNVTMSLDGSGMWNATCKGKVYLCTAAASVGNNESLSCAPVPP